MERSRSINPLLISISVVLLTVAAVFLSLKQCSKNSSSDTNVASKSKDEVDTTNDTANTTPSKTDEDHVEIAPSTDTENPKNLAKKTAPTSDQGTTAENKAIPLNGDEEEVTAAIKNFMAAIVKLDPNTARQYVDTNSVSYAKLAGLCIILEEGDYRLANNRPVRKMFLKDDSAGWLAKVESQGTDQNAMFSINTKRKDANSPWKITEISLDKLLADYAGKFAGGDIHYIPLIKSPKGGDSLAIYFDLDSEALTARTRRQLDIVISLLKDDVSKKLTISGHTDALGSDSHNLKLSKQRASQVMDYLARQGVNRNQMNIVGYGKSLPRLPNTTVDGKDAPDGRRANRRAEILLNF